MLTGRWRDETKGQVPLRLFTPLSLIPLLSEADPQRNNPPPPLFNFCLRTLYGDAGVISR